MARPRVAICNKKCKGKRIGAFRKCVKACAKKGGRRKRRR